MGIPSAAAASRARAGSREAIASMRETAPRCIAGITFSVAIFATPRTPHLTSAHQFLPLLLVRLSLWAAADRWSDCRAIIQPGYSGFSALA